MKKGLIFSASHNSPYAIHPIIFWGWQNKDEFLGLMITHSPDFGNLNLNDSTYFVGVGNRFRNTYLVEELLLKPVDWLVNPRIIGELSQTGIQYVETIVQHLRPITWDEHLANMK